jgi:hypothetical protein
MHEILEKVVALIIFCRLKKNCMHEMKEIKEW